MKIFEAKVEIESVIEFDVQAEDENVAAKKAKELAMAGFSGKSRVTNIDTEIIGETPFKIGSKVKHQLFGNGTIKDLKLTTSGAGVRGWMATIEFEDKKQRTKGISISPGKAHLELINA